MVHIKKTKKKEKKKRKKERKTKEPIGKVAARLQQQGPWPGHISL